MWVQLQQTGPDAFLHRRLELLNSRYAFLLVKSGKREIQDLETRQTKTAGKMGKKKKCDHHMITLLFFYKGHLNDFYNNKFMFILLCTVNVGMYLIIYIYYYLLLQRPFSAVIIIESAKSAAARHSLLCTGVQ